MVCLWVVIGCSLKLHGDQQVMLLLAGYSDPPHDGGLSNFKRCCFQVCQRTPKLHSVPKRPPHIALAVKFSNWHDDVFVSAATGCRGKGFITLSR